MIDWSIPTCVGFTRLPPLVRGQRPGPSPRAWGLRNDLIGFQERVRSIPTCVGFTGDTYDVDPRRPVHPHVRGVYGLEIFHPPGLVRSIPTCVGFTSTGNPSRWRTAVHPHVRGVYFNSFTRPVHMDGPSPRAWGLQCLELYRNSGPRSIPTCVGFTSPAPNQARRQTVHPHVRGVYDRRIPPAGFPPGPSPRAWGLPVEVVNGVTIRRSIPTCVGFTTGRNVVVEEMTVHPHVRGVYIDPGRWAAASTGPSPRAWGLLGGAISNIKNGRSIPTCVGFTAAIILDVSCCCGPSPRAWGLPHVEGLGNGLDRSIPTCVGFTPSAPTENPVPAGPSPRAWGLRKYDLAEDAKPRSIPTCVGFTAAQTPYSAGSPVHPHVRGVYGFQRSRPMFSLAVHPHVRGVYTEIKSKISRVSIKTALLPAEKFKILFLVKIKGSAAAFLDHTIFRDQSPPELHFEIALHL